jgi:hypothetical protein
MSEKKTDEGPEGNKSDLELVEEALVGTHQEAPRHGGEDEAKPVGSHEAKPPVPGHRSP